MIINTYDQLKAAKAAGFDQRKLIGIGWHTPDASNSRDVSVHQWSVSSPFFQTDPDAAWYDRGSKVFTKFGHTGTHYEQKAAALKVAQGWATKQYGITEWAKNSLGAYVPKEVNDNFPIPKRKRNQK